MSSAFALNRLGFGSAALSRDKQDALRLLETALDSGITHFDTARMYGDGAAERVLGEVARRRRADMVIVSKAGITPPTRAHRIARRALGFIPALRAAGEPRYGQFAPAQVRKSVEASLRALNTDRIDALLLHEIAPGRVTDGLKRALDALKAQGKIDRVGIATSPAHTSAILRSHPDLCEIIQVPAARETIAAPPAAFTIIHSPLRFRLDALVTRLNDDNALHRQFQETFGFDVGDRERLARLLLANELARDPSAIVLFSSTSPARIKANAELMHAPPPPVSGLEPYLWPVASRIA